MKKTLGVAALLLTFALPAAAQGKRRVAVVDFDYGTVSNSVIQIFGSNQDIGRGISDLLIKRLVNGGQYTVIERRLLDQLMKEQNFSNSNRADSATAAKLGKLAGVDAIITGSITTFGRDDRNVGISGGGYGLGRFGLGNVGKRDNKAVVQITARLISVDTGEILASIDGRGESKRGGLNLGGAGGGWGGGGGGAVDFGSSNFGSTIIGEATNQAVDQLANELQGKATALPTRKVEIDALVADVSGNTLVITAGSKAGLKVGDSLLVRRVGRTIKNPATGAVLRREETTLGEIVLTEVDGDSAVGTYKGSQPPKVGDAVKTPQ